MFTCVINTIALAKDADRISSGGRPYSERAWLLRNVILPWYHSLKVFDEIVVVGEFEEGPFHTYVPCPQANHTESDPLLMRDRGYAATSGDPNDWVLFQHDDHLWDPRNFPPGESRAARDYVLSPARRSRGRQALGEPLNDGNGEYINGHALLMRRMVAELCPWSEAPPVHAWDKGYTQVLTNHGVPWRYAPEYVVLDIEPFAESWSDRLPAGYLHTPTPQWSPDEGLADYTSGSTEPWTADVVASLARALHASTVVETGTFEGRTTTVLWDALRDLRHQSHLYTIESDNARADATAKTLDASMHGREGSSACAVTLKVGDALVELARFPEGSVDLVFLDDDHTRDHVAAEIVAALRVLRPRGVVCLHDVTGTSPLGELVRVMGGVVLDFPRIHASGGLGILVKP
jgi:predicted O-methyltransferase YrrM